jgi:hypothetical protein
VRVVLRSLGMLAATGIVWSDVKVVEGDGPPGALGIGPDEHAYSSPWARPRGDADESRATSDAPAPEALSNTLPRGSIAEPEPPPTTPWSRRRWLLSAAAGIAVLTLLVWSIDRASGDPGSDGDEQGADTTQAAAPLQPGSTVPQADPAVGGAEPLPPSSTTTGTAATETQQWRLSSAEIHPRAAELDIEIIVVTPDEIVEYNTGTGERISFELPTFTAQPPVVQAGQDWIRLQNLDLKRTDLYQDHDRPERLEGGFADFTLRQPGTDLFWVVEGGREPPRVYETDRAGNETGVSLDVGRHGIVAADPAGGVVVEAPGGTYQVTPDDSQRITTGRVIALNAQSALVEDCGDDEMMSCGLAVLDRGTGDSRPLTFVPPPSADAANPYQEAFTGAISPDNRYAALSVNGMHQGLGVIDLTSGAFTNLAAYPESGLWWAPDGRNVIYMRGEQLFMYDFDEGAELAIVPDSDGLRSFAVRT